MTWTRLDEDFDQHPKIVAAGPLAELLHIHALIYCNRYLTDGFIPTTVVRRLANGPEHRLVERLVKLGIWVKVDGGYQIHDFLEYQPSKAKVLAERERKASAGQAGGVARAKARALAESKLVPVSVPVAVSYPVPETASTVLTNGALALSGIGLCERLRESLDQWGAKARVTHEWRVAEDRLLRLDKRSAAEALAVLEWATHDDFWRPNVLSLPTFRKQYDKLRGQMLRRPPGSETAGTQQGDRLRGMAQTLREVGQ